MQRQSRISITRPEPDVAVVSLAGEHDLASAQDAAHAFEELVAGRNNVVVDLSALTFIDTTTVHALVVGRRLANAAGVSFLVHLPEGHAARRMLDLMRVLDVLPTSATLSEAISRAHASDQSPPAS